jgi:hypothetical protein
MIPIVVLRQQFMARAAKRNDNVIKAWGALDIVLRLALIVKEAVVV